MTTPGDSAGVPWEGREVPSGDFAGDTGESSPLLMRALTTGGERDVMRHLATTRLFVPMNAIATETADGEHGQMEDKEADMAVVLLKHPDGRTALPVFSSIADLTAFDSSVRPVPVEAARAAQAAVTEQADLMVLDCASEQAFEVRGSMVWALSQQREWIPAEEDPFVASAVERACAAYPGIVEHSLGQGAPDGQGVLQITLTLVEGFSEEQVQQLVTELAEELAADGELRARIDGLSFAIV